MSYICITVLNTLAVRNFELQIKFTAGRVLHVKFHFPAKQLNEERNVLFLSQWAVSERGMAEFLYFKQDVKYSLRFLC